MEKLDVKRCCKILGLAPGATLAQLKEQRGRLAQQWHPDKEKDPKRKAILEDKMKDINNAFDFLKAALSGTPAGLPPRGPQAETQPPPPPAKKPWEAEAEERRKKTAEREEKERREEEAQKRQWKAEFQRVQQEAARLRQQQQAEASRLREWFAEEKERQEWGAEPQRSSRARQEADPIPPTPQEPEYLTRPREPRPPARKEEGDRKHIYLRGKCTKCGRSKEQIASYDLACL